MNKLFSTLFSSLRAKFTALWTRLRLWMTPTFWQTQIFTRLRRGFSKLFDVRCVCLYQTLVNNAYCIIFVYFC